MDKPVAILMAGLPGSGKSTFAEKIRVNGEKPEIHSSDALREELYGNAATQGNNKALFEKLYKRVRNDLLAGNSIVLDATSITKYNRKNFIDTVSDICFPVCLVVGTKIEECLRRNQNRSRVVPVDVINRMAKQWESPSIFEGFRSVLCITEDSPDWNLSTYNISF